MHLNKKKNIRFRKSFLVLCVVTIVALLCSCDNKKINDGDINISLDENDKEADLIRIDPSVEYLHYLAPSKTFISAGKRNKKDIFCFAGDVFFSNKVRDGYDKDGIDGILDKSYQKKINEADLSIANLECSITDNVDNPADKTFTFALPTKYVSGLKDLGIDLYVLANNHILDYGMEALKDTIKTLDDNSINHIGAADNLYDAKKAFVKEIDGKRYAIIAASAVLPLDAWKATSERGGVHNGYDVVSLVNEIKLIRPFFDKVIVYMHWGNELEDKANDSERRTAHIIVNAGADLVVGTHSHTVQEIEYYNGVPIVYSLGNFVYGGQMRDMLMLEAVFDYSENSEGDLQLKVYPGVSGYQMTRRTWGETELADKYKALSEKSVECYIDSYGFVNRGVESEVNSWAWESGN